MTRIGLLDHNVHCTVHIALEELFSFFLTSHHHIIFLGQTKVVPINDRFFSDLFAYLL